MLKLSLLGAVAALVVALAVPTASAVPPDRFVFVDDVTFQSGFLSDLCDTPVFISLNGTLHIILRTDKKGVLHETDAFQKWALTTSAPDFGTSYSFKFGPGFFKYPDGVPVNIGDPSIVTFLGVGSNIPGLHAIAGRTVVEGVVIDITPEGVPIVDTSGPLISEVGNHEDPAVVRAAVCAALTG